MRTYSFQELKDIIEGRINSISYQREMYKMDVRELPDDIGFIDVIYNGHNIVSFHYMVTNRYVAGKRQVKGSIIVGQASPVPCWYSEYDAIIQINEWLKGPTNNHKDIMEILDEYLPIAKEAESTQIEEVVKKHHIFDYEIKFDTFQKKYILQLDLKNLLKISGCEDNNSNEEGDIWLYKYMSLDTYYAMLQHSTFRINSIVSMNDVTETFWMNALLYGDDQLSKEQKYLRVVKNKNILISSFSDKKDDPVMWRLYGDNGKGVCLGFTIARKSVAKIRYINESDKDCCALKEIARELYEKGIEISYADADSLQYYIKSTIYNIESEYRLIWDRDEGVQNVAIYDGLLALYKDFEYDKDSGAFKGINLKFTTLIIGNNIPYYESNYPLLVALSDEKYKDLRISRSEIKTFR